MERDRGIEPLLAAWKAADQPLTQSRSGHQKAGHRICITKSIFALEKLKSDGLVKLSHAPQQKSRTLLRCAYIYQPPRPSLGRSLRKRTRTDIVIPGNHRGFTRKANKTFGISTFAAINPPAVHAKRCIFRIQKGGWRPATWTWCQFRSHTFSIQFCHTLKPESYLIVYTRRPLSKPTQATRTTHSCQKKGLSNKTREAFDMAGLAYRITPRHPLAPRSDRSAYSTGDPVRSA